jgi:hypothetical protein
MQLSRIKSLFEMARLAPAVLGLVVVLVSSVAMASNYYLTDLGRFDTAQVILFREAGVQTTEQVLEASLTPKARMALAAKVKLSEPQLTMFAQECEFLQINGVGPKAARLIQASGVKNVKDLAARKSTELLPLLVAANRQQRITETQPSLDLVQYWIEEAHRVPYHLK